ncbi:peroxiredoxin [Patescibacteria group bacterium]|jgi:peroxiredoxin Q/BCP|nr:peroxiredoxin [Patescibacteria group bacterium]
MKKTLQIGDQAPSFELKSSDGETVRLAEALQLGPVVLIFYPGDRTPGCTVQLCAIRDEWQEFRDYGLQVFGVNHGDAASHRAFSAAHRFPFPLLVDENKAVSKSYGAIHALLGIQVIRRSVIGISQDGVVRYLRRGLPKNAEILKAMKPFAKA